jgi:hypothetical protein
MKYEITAGEDNTADGCNGDNKITWYELINTGGLRVKLIVYQEENERSSDPHEFVLSFFEKLPFCWVGISVEKNYSDVEEPVGGDGSRVAEGSLVDVAESVEKSCDEVREEED